MSVPGLSVGRKQVIEPVVALFRDGEVRTLFFAYFGLFIVTDAFQQAVPLYFDAVGLSTTVLGLGLAVANASEALVSPITGVLADSYDRLALAFGGGLGLAVLLALFGFTTGPVQLVVLLVGISVVKLLFSNSVAPAFNDALDEETDGLGWGIRDTSIYLGGAVGLGLGSTVVSTTGSVGNVFLLLAPVVLGVSLALWYTRDGGGVGSVSVDEVREAVTTLAVVDAYRDVSSWGLLGRFLVIDALVGVGMGMSLTFLPVFATDVATTAAGFLLVFSLSHVFSVPMSLLGGVLTDRYSRKWLYVANFVTETAMLAAFAVTQDVVFLAVGIGLYVVQTTFEPAVVSYFFDQFEEAESGRVWSIKGTVAKVAGVVGPAVGGVVYASDPHLVFGIGGTLVGIGALVSLTLPS